MTNNKQALEYIQEQAELLAQCIQIDTLKFGTADREEAELLEIYLDIIEALQSKQWLDIAECPKDVVVLIKGSYRHSHFDKYGAECLFADEEYIVKGQWSWEFDKFVCAHGEIEATHYQLITPPV